MTSTTLSRCLIVALTTCLWSCEYVNCSESHHDNKRAPVGFTGVRGKKSIMPDSYLEYQGAGSERSSGERGSGVSVAAATKRALASSASNGFVSNDELAQVWAGNYLRSDGVNKRLRPSGFMGMRGKKDMESYVADNNYQGVEGTYNRPASGEMTGRDSNSQDLLEGNKRAPMMGFVGMRGKKDYDELEELNNKRAPSGFFGMRGKKIPRQSSFFGMRGKKYPYEFRGKFVGVRGKKLDDAFRAANPDLDLNQLMLLLTENNQPSESSEIYWNGQNNLVGDHGMLEQI